ncbi:MAG: SET domain-containing protein-lysine N-methyltransferase [Sphingobacteriales bacterium]|nr:SET domain-containing protein-lysine N-methyltransferase [Sphingobacteriales bacterium]
MTSLFQKKITRPEGIEIKESPLHGMGVFACKSFKPGAVIETAPVILLTEADKKLLQPTRLFGYYFLLNHKKTPAALGLGFSSLYNHSYKANAVYTVSYKRSCLLIRACRAIQPGEEITLNYNGLPLDPAPVYFPPDTP